MPLPRPVPPPVMRMRLCCSRSLWNIVFVSILRRTDYMDWLRCRHLCSAGVLLILVGVQSGIPAEVESAWLSLAPGMEIRRVQSRKRSIVGDSKITVLRIDPGLWELEVIGVFQTGEVA